MEIKKFSEFNLSQNIMKALNDMGFVEPTPIQAKSINVVLEGKDVIGQAQTGTGKTAAFGIPLLEKMDLENDSVQALILCPTRELALQVSREFEKLAKYMKNVGTTCVYGGERIDIQFRQLRKRPKVVIGTPGRVIDHMRRKTLKLHDLKMLVLDEADEMLKMGFREDMETILKETPSERQTLLFSATMPKPILDIVDTYQKDPELIKVKSKTITVDKIDQYYYIVKESSKIDLIIRLLDYHNFRSSIIFCNTKKGVDEVVSKLQESDYIVEGLHGDFKQQHRDRVMQSFRKGHVKILVATDVAARGIDVKDIDIVFNYDIPQEDEIYVHRIGRTGRAGRKGISITFVNLRQKRRLDFIENYTNSQMKKGTIPTVEDIKYAGYLDIYEDIKTNIDKYKNKDVHQIIKNLNSEGHSDKEIINSLLSVVVKGKERNYNHIEDITRQKKPRERKDSRGSRDTRSRQGKFVTLELNIGKTEKMRPQILVSYIVKHSNISKQAIGDITIKKKNTTVQIESRRLRQVVNSIKGKTYKGTRITVREV